MDSSIFDKEPWKKSDVRAAKEYLLEVLNNAMRFTDALGEQTPREIAVIFSQIYRGKRSEERGLSEAGDVVTDGARKSDVEDTLRNAYSRLRGILPDECFQTCDEPDD